MTVAVIIRAKMIIWGKKLTLMLLSKYMPQNKNQPISDENIIIDKELGLVFTSEDAVLKHFKKAIDGHEKQFIANRPKKDFTDDESANMEEYLEEVLNGPDEIWQEKSKYGDYSTFCYVKNFKRDELEFSYVALTYVSENVPTFIFLHFPTKYSTFADTYRKGEIIYDRHHDDIKDGGIEGDAMSEGDMLAIGLFKAMLKLRGEDDIPQKTFKDYAEFREQTIEEADEIWRTMDLSGNTLVYFIKDFSKQESITGDLFYVVATQEDAGSNSHALLFSFPTMDESLVDRYRNGENLQAEEVIQESSH